MYIHILYLYFRQASLSPKQNFGAIENRHPKTLTVKSFEKPEVLWMKFCCGKISTWLVTEINNKGKRLSSTYFLSSTIIPV
jgi:hypothetical protein